MDFSGVEKLIELGWPAIAGIVLVFVIAGMGRGGRRKPPTFEEPRAPKPGSLPRAGRAPKRPRRPRL